MRRQLSPVKCYRAPTLPLDLRVPTTFYVVRRIPHLFFSHSSLACQAVASRHAVALREGWSLITQPAACAVYAVTRHFRKTATGKIRKYILRSQRPAIAPQTKKFAAFLDPFSEFLASR